MLKVWMMILKVLSALQWLTGNCGLVTQVGDSMSMVKGI